jgi:hypothetical protein
MKKIIYLFALLITLITVNPVLALDPPVDGYPAVTRFWSNTYRGHFYTADASEATTVEANYSSEVWRSEGTAFYVFAPWLCDLARSEGEPVPEGICSPVYRFWSDTYKHHFYTISETEKNNILANMPEWHYEGLVYAANQYAFGYASSPLYRFWSDKYKAHFYTISESEKNNIISTMPEWRYEGIAYYVISEESRPIFF